MALKPAPLAPREFSRQFVGLIHELEKERGVSTLGVRDVILVDGSDLHEDCAQKVGPGKFTFDVTRHDLDHRRP